MSNVEQANPRSKKHSRFFPHSLMSGSVLQNRTLLAISLTVFATYAGIGMVVPVRILFAESRGASLAIIGAMASAYLISNFIFQYPTGWLADRWGRKQVMLIGLVIQAVLSLAYLLITDPVQFVVLRFLEGIAGATLLPPARALIIDTVPTERQGEAYGVFGAFFSAGFLLGPGIGGLIASAGFTAAFIGSTFFRILAIVLVATMIHNTNKRDIVVVTETQIQPASYKALFALPLLGAYLIAFGDYLYLGFDITLMPLWLHDHLGASIALIGVAYVTFSLPNAILSPLGGRLADRKRRSALIYLFGLAQVPLYILYGTANAAWPVILLFAVHGFVYAFIQPAIDATVATASASAMRARVQGFYTTIGLIGSFIGASVFTTLYTLNFRLPLFVIAVVYGTCVIIGGTMIRVAEKKNR